MINAKAIGFTIAFAIVGILFLLTGCGGSGSSGITFPTPTLPSDAVVFDATNALDGADAAMSSGDSLGAVARGTNLPFTVQDAIELVTDKVLNRAKTSDSVVTGVTYPPDDCLYGGTQTETSNETARGVTGTVTFSGCNEDELSIINGSFSFIASFNDPVLNMDIGGNLTFTLVADGTVITMVMNVSETINLDTFAFSFSQTFAASSVPIGSITGGFLVTTPVAFSGDLTNGNVAGQMLVHGANGTQIRISVTAPDTATVEVDDGTGTGWVTISTSYSLL